MRRPLPIRLLNGFRSLFAYWWRALERSDERRRSRPYWESMQFWFLVFVALAIVSAAIRNLVGSGVAPA